MTREDPGVVRAEGAKGPGSIWTCHTMKSPWYSVSTIGKRMTTGDTYPCENTSFEGLIFGLTRTFVYRPDLSPLTIGSTAGLRWDKEEGAYYCYEEDKEAFSRWIPRDPDWKTTYL